MVAGLPMPAGLSATVQDIRSGSRDYRILFRARNRIRSTYLLLLFLLTTLVFFASSWLALFLSKQVTRPVEALADAMDAVAAGHYAHRVKVEATEELGELVRSFNRMAEDLEESRALAETSTTQLSAANRALEERRSELETVLETIPSAVVTLDPEMRVLQANRASRNLLSPREHRDLAGMPLESILPREIADELIVLLRRSKRMGVAATEIELPGRGAAERDRHRRPAGTGQGSRGVHPGAGGCYRLPACAAADGVERSRATGGPRNQESADADCPFRGTHPQACRSPYAGLGLGHSQMQRRDSGLRRRPCAGWLTSSPRWHSSLPRGPRSAI